MQILTVVIGIIFVLLLLSLLATTMMELLSSLFSLRGRNLTKALRNMLASSDRNEILVDEFQRNSLYRHLTQQYGKRTKGFVAPSYMSAETFQSILMDIILKDGGSEELEERIKALPDEDLRNVLLQLLRESGGQLDLFRLEIQNWYNNVMDRAAGWYKRYTQKILLFMGLGIALVFNADTVALYDRLSNDPETLATLVEAAERYVDAREEAGSPINEPTQQPTTTPYDPFDTSAANTSALPVGAGPTTYNTATGTASSQNIAADADFQRSLAELKDLLNNEINEVRGPLGLGWEGVNMRELSPYDLVSKILGFALTALAVSLGAPFWFDMLKKLVNIRSSGARPYEN